MRRSLTAAVLLVAVLPAAASALPPRPPSAAKTRAAIRHLKIAKPLSMEGYSRDRFPHWISQGGGCDTRDRVLIRDGQNVTVGSGCRIIAGTWRSFYDGLTVRNASRVDIDLAGVVKVACSGTARFASGRISAILGIIFARRVHNRVTPPEHRDFQRDRLYAPHRVNLVSRQIPGRR